MGLELQNVIVLLLGCHINKEGCVHMRVNHMPNWEGDYIYEWKNNPKRSNDAQTQTVQQPN